MTALNDLLRQTGADARGPCQDDPDLWFSGDAYDRQTARTVCASCPMKDPCLETAIRNAEQFGIWGGLTPEERSTLIERKGKGKPKARRQVARMDVEDIRRQALARHTLTQIAQELGVQPESVMRRLRNAGEDELVENLGGRSRTYRKRRPRAQAIADVEACAARGLTIAQTAAELNYSTPGNLNGWLKRVTPNTLLKFTNEKAATP